MVHDVNVHVCMVFFAVSGDSRYSTADCKVCIYMCTMILCRVAIIIVHFFNIAGALDLI